MSWMWGIGLTGLVAVVLWAIEQSKRRTHPVPPGFQADLEFPHEREFELYHNALSLCSMKSRFCMAELQIPYKSHHVDLIETSCYENIRPDFLRVNPGGTVPVLLHNGHPIYESHEQIRYVAQFAPEGVPSLIPEDADLRAEMEEWVDLSSLTDALENPGKSAGNSIPGQTVPLFCTMVEKIPLVRILEGFLFHFDKFRPLLFALLKIRGIDNLHKIPPIKKVILRSREFLFGFLDQFEARLEKGGGPWLLGDQFTLADVSWLAIFERMRQASCEHVFLNSADRPLTAAYWDRLKARPAYGEAILGHSHPIVEYGRERIAEAKATNPDVRILLEGV
jgi:glutathione S-transferase